MAAKEGHQEHPLKVYWLMWGALFVLSAASYATDFMQDGALRTFLILLFINIMLLILGMIMEILPIMLILARVASTFVLNRIAPIRVRYVPPIGDVLDFYLAGVKKKYRGMGVDLMLVLAVAENMAATISPTIPAGRTARHARM